MVLDTAVVAVLAAVAFHSSSYFRQSAHRHWEVVVVVAAAVVVVMQPRGCDKTLHRAVVEVVVVERRSYLES